MFDATQRPFIRLAELTAEKTSKVVYWVGAGVSRSVGLPGWAELRAQLQETLERDCRFDKEGSRRNLPAYIQNIEDNWTAFQKLKESLGESYFAEVRSAIVTKAAQVSVPPVLRKIWATNPWAILSLNIDGLAARAFVEEHGSAHIPEFNGEEFGDSASVLQSPNKFVANLHGVGFKRNSWIFAKDELDRLFANQAYIQAIVSVASTTRIVFVGITVDDTAVGGLLSTLRGRGLSFGNHFWLTERTDPSARLWASEAGVEIIHYSASNDHAELLEALDQLRTFKTEEVKAPPVVAAPVAPRRSEALPSSTELESLSAEDIRILLNLYADELAELYPNEVGERLDELRTQYESAIYKSWFASVNPPNNVWFEHTLVRELGRGEFGRVFEALSAGGERRAIKILHQAGANDTYGRLAAFRRGVRSMRILSNANVAGMVGFYTASELPAFVVMEFVNGPNLEDAIRRGTLKETDELLVVAVRVAEIVKNGHALPERVLHRDLRPMNIMLEKQESSPDFRVIVLDFDLSWHKDALERSAQLSASHGYLAPEQTRQMAGATSRHASVDSYGLGMTIYFMFSREHPYPGMNQHAGWRSQVRKAAFSMSKSGLKSLPHRLARLIVRATREYQSERPDMTEMFAELYQINQAFTEGTNTTLVEVLAEEILARLVDDYDWDVARVAGVINLAHGVTIRTCPDLVGQNVTLTLDWRHLGMSEKKTLLSRSQVHVAKHRQKLEKAGWSIERCSIQDGLISLGLSIGSFHRTGTFVKASNALSDFAHSLTAL